MAEPRSTAAGAIVALLVLAGAGIGVALGQPTIGVLAGAGLGTLAAVLLWLRERRRIGR